MFTAFICILFGANAVAIKISLLGLGVFTTAGLRFSIATIAIFLWAKFTQKSFIPNRHQRKQLLILAVSFTVQICIFYVGVSKTSASHATLLSNLLPFFVLFLAHHFIPGDVITKRKLLGMLLGFAGVVFVFLEKGGTNADFQLGDFIILVGAILWACRIVYLKRIINNFEPFHLAFYPMIFSIPFFFLGGYFWDEAMIVYIDPEVVLSLLYQGLVTASFGFLAWNNLLQKYGATSLHSFVFIMPVSGVVLAGLFLKEPITANILIAMFFIVTGIIIIHTKSKMYLPLFRLGKNI
jgi:drug/metabolite transporter (DMT)-like permease